jgi:N-acetylmuramate 1-kinase
LRAGSGPEAPPAVGRSDPPEPLRAFLAERFGAGEPIVDPLSGDASTRRYFRVRSGTTTAVAALYPEPFDPAALPFLVVRSLLAGWGLPVPAVLDCDGPRGVVLLEDLGDVTVQERLRRDPPARDGLYGEALDQLARLQGASAGATGAAPCFHLAFDVGKLTWELEFFREHFVESHRGRILSGADRDALAEGFGRLSREIAGWPRVLCHRDFHSRNLMVAGGGLRWIDFQDARMGPATYDLASLLRDSYVDLDEAFVAERAEAFRRSVLAGEPREGFVRRFELTALQRNLKALGTFGYMESTRGGGVYLPYIPRTLERARRNLARFPEMSGLRRALARHIDELR